jgi:hypothetical protein
MQIHENTEVIELNFMYLKDAEKKKKQEQKERERKKKQKQQSKKSTSFFKW